MQHAAFPLQAKTIVKCRQSMQTDANFCCNTHSQSSICPSTACVNSVHPYLLNTPFPLHCVTIAIMSTGIKAIKLYAWEQSFKERILSLRHLELTQIRHVAYLEVIQSLVFGSTPILIALSAFAVYTAQGYPLTPAVAFPALALFNLLRFPITMLPWYLMEFINGWVALGRMQHFMQVSF